MNTNVIWTSEEDEILIDFVRNNEALYNVKCKDYRKAQLKQNMWNIIGTVLKKPGSDCCKRWVYVRDYYIRRRGKPGVGSSGEAAKKRADLLSFLDNMPSSQRNTITNVIGDELPFDSEITEDTHTQANNEETSTKIEETEVMTRIHCNENINEHGNNKGADSKVNFIRNKKKKKLTHSEGRLQLLKQIVQRKSTRVQDQLDETDLFFSSMAKIVKNLPRYEQVQLRMQISSLIGNVELRCISNESRQISDLKEEMS